MNLAVRVNMERSIRFILCKKLVLRLQDESRSTGLNLWLDGVRPTKALTEKAAKQHCGMEIASAAVYTK
jgi:hypothetical protein